jgi:hypothetical protein
MRGIPVMKTASSKLGLRRLQWIESSTKLKPSNSKGTEQPLPFLTGTQKFNSDSGPDRKMQNFGSKVLDDMMNVIICPANKLEAETENSMCDRMLTELW